MASYSYVLSLGARNSVVAYFKDLVDKAALSETEKAANNVLHRFESSKLVSFIQTTARDIYSSVTKNTSQKRKIAEFTQELYDKAINLPEAQSITFEYVTTVANYKHGLFKGGNIYRDYNGTLESTDNAEKLGWIYIDNTNNEYCLFSQENKSFIIALSDFEPKPIVADFYPLYEKLQASQYSKADSIVDDAFTAFSLIASYRAVLSNAMSNLYAAKSLLMDEYYNPISSFIESFEGKMIGAELPSINTPSWLKRDKTQDKLNEKDSFKDDLKDFKSSMDIDDIINDNEVNTSVVDSFLSSVKSIIPGLTSIIPSSESSSNDNNKQKDPNYERKFLGWKMPLLSPRQVLPNYERLESSKISLLGKDSLGDFDLTLVQAVIYDSPDDKKIRNVLCCYQQPDTVSYSASSQFDSPQPRGSQIPFNFYQCANAITLNFTLKWHIDEVRSMYKNEGTKSLCLQDIAELAEKFTRPVTLSKGSILPRTVFVILPGVTRRGYMTEAQISLSGDMTGTKVDYSLVRNSFSSASPGEDNYVSRIGYQYTQIEIAFSLLVTNDVTLHSQGEIGDYITPGNYNKNQERINRMIYASGSNKDIIDIGDAEQDTKDAEETAKEKSEEVKNSIEEENQALIDAANADAKAKETGYPTDQQKAKDAKNNANNKAKKVDEAKKAKKAADKAEEKAKKAEEKAKKARNEAVKAKANALKIKDPEAKVKAEAEAKKAAAAAADAKKEADKASAAALESRKEYARIAAAKAKAGSNKMTP